MTHVHDMDTAYDGVCKDCDPTQAPYTFGEAVADALGSYRVSGDLDALIGQVEMLRDFAADGAEHTE